MSAFAIIAIKTGLTVNVFISTHIRLKSEVVAAGMLYRTDLPHSTACLLNPLPFLKLKQKEEKITLVAITKRVVGVKNRK